MKKSIKEVTSLEKSEKKSFKIQKKNYFEIFNKILFYLKWNKQDSIIFTFVQDSIKTRYSHLFFFIIKYLFEIILIIPDSVEEDFTENFLESDFKKRQIRM